MSEINISTLATFRVVGIQQTVARENMALGTEKLLQQWQMSPPTWQGFSQTWYVVFRYIDDISVEITLGKLMSTDAILPDKMCDVWLAPQQYAVLPLADLTELNQNHIQQIIEQTGSLKRSEKADILIYKTNSPLQLYVGLQGEVEIMEE